VSEGPEAGRRTATQRGTEQPTDLRPTYTGLNNSTDHYDNISIHEDVGDGFKVVYHK